MKIAHLFTKILFLVIFAQKKTAQIGENAQSDTSGLCIFHILSGKRL